MGEEHLGVASDADDAAATDGGGDRVAAAGRVVVGEVAAACPAVLGSLEGGDQLEAARSATRWGNVRGDQGGMEEAERAPFLLVGVGLVVALEHVRDRLGG